MKKLFVETNAYNMVLFVDNEGMAYVVEEKSFDKELTLDVARAADYSNLDNCETAQECQDSMGFGDIIELAQCTEYFNSVVEF